MDTSPLQCRFLHQPGSLHSMFQYLDCLCSNGSDQRRTGGEKEDKKEKEEAKKAWSHSEPRGETTMQRGP